MSYQKVTGPLMANSHPGSYCGQDAYSDMLVTDVNPREREREEEGDVIETTEGNEILRLLQKAYGEEEVLKWGIRVLDLVQQKKVLFDGLLKGSVPSQAKEGNGMDDSTLPCEELVADWILRDMWERQKRGCSPQGWESSEQQHRQFTEIMQKLSYQNASTSKPLFNMWSKGEGIRLLQQTLYSIQKIRKSSMGEWKGGDGMMDVSTNNTVVRRLTPL